MVLWRWTALVCKSSSFYEQLWSHSMKIKLLHLLKENMRFNRSKCYCVQCLLFHVSTMNIFLTLASFCNLYLSNIWVLDQSNFYFQKLVCYNYVIVHIYLLCIVGTGAKSITYCYIMYMYYVLSDICNWKI